MPTDSGSIANPSVSRNPLSECVDWKHRLRSSPHLEPCFATFATLAPQDRQRQIISGAWKSAELRAPQLNGGPSAGDLRVLAAGRDDRSLSVGRDWLTAPKGEVLAGRRESMKRRQVMTLSLFSGAGGLDIGFHDAGFDIVAAVEIEPTYAATLVENSGPGTYFGPGLAVHCQDIRKFDAAPYVDAGIECIIGGPPCQTFSAAGRRSGGVLGTDDERGQLFHAYIDILDIIRPKVFVFENVYGLPGANGGEPWREIVKGFAKVGYELAAEVLDAADYGVPQHRERVIMVGSRVGSFRFPMPTHGPDSPSGLPLTRARDALAGLPEVTAPKGGLGGLYGHLLPLVPPGLNYSYFTREMGHPAPQFAWRSKFHDFLAKADPESPVRTIKSKPGKFTGPFHWDSRHFTSAELKRLQSFPDEYVVTGNYNKVVEQIGNSVPPGLARAIAESVREQLLEPADELTFPVRGVDFQSTFRQRQRERNAHFHRIAEEAIRALGPEDISQLTVGAIDKDTYFATFDGWFGRKFSVKAPAVGAHELVLRVKLHRDGGEISIDIQEEGLTSRRSVSVDVDIAGLEKYMDHTDRVKVQAKLSTAQSLLPVWAVIERELVRQSRFFSLIDIYGHYANRGDTVVVKTRVRGGNAALARAINYCGNSANCGRPLSLDEAAELMAVEIDDLLPWIDQLRMLRWDIRVKGTHRTLASDSVLVTYPFPALSAKAHFDKGLASGDLATLTDDIAV